MNCRLVRWTFEFPLSPGHEHRLANRTASLWRRRTEDRQRGSELGSDQYIVAAELRFGARKKGSAALARQLDAVLGVLQILPLEIPVDEAYAGLRATLEAAGTMIDANDTLIGAHALSLDMILVTDNVREFERIPGLVVENWLR